MPKQLIDLFEVQQLDLLVLKEERAVSALYDALTLLDAGLAKLAAQRDALSQQADQTDLDARSLKQTVDAERDKIRKWEARLGDIRNQREYQALQRETEGSRRANRDAEDKLSELYTQKETLDAQLVELDEKSDEGVVAQEAEKERVEQAAQALQARIDALKARRDALLPRVNTHLFRRYDAIRGRRAGIGLSLVAQGSCTGCNMRLPPQLYNILQRGDTIEQCPSCTRLMVWEQHVTRVEAANTSDAPQASAPAS